MTIANRTQGPRDETDISSSTTILYVERRLHACRGNHVCHRSRRSPGRSASEARSGRHALAEEGKVISVKELGGNPVLVNTLLVNALAEAAKKWKYEPANRESLIEMRFEFR